MTSTPDRPAKAPLNSIKFRQQFELNEQAHRQKCDLMVITTARRGQLFAFILGLAFLFVGGGLVYGDHDVAGATIAGTASVSIAAAFLTGARRTGQDSRPGTLDGRQLPGQRASTDEPTPAEPSADQEPAA